MITMRRILFTRFSTSAGMFLVAEYEGKIIKISFGEVDEISFLYWLDARMPGIRAVEDIERISPVLNEAEKQIREYFEGKRKTLDFPYEMIGTVFQKKVWEAMSKIPYGEVRSYGEVAGETGKPTAGRAVGNACNRNPLPIIIPCHRVVGADGSLVGFGGGIELKDKLLKIEKENKDNNIDK
jgi:methylated-DNA-[protein]-cysteine S-methyltransferase